MSKAIPEVSPKIVKKDDQALVRKSLLKRSVQIPYLQSGRRRKVDRYLTTFVIRIAPKALERH